MRSRDEIEKQIDDIRRGRTSGEVSVDATKLEMMEVTAAILLDIRDLLERPYLTHGEVLRREHEAGVITKKDANGRRRVV